MPHSGAGGGPNPCGSRGFETSCDVGPKARDYRAFGGYSSVMSAGSVGTLMRLGISRLCGTGPNRAPRSAEPLGGSG